MAPLRWGVAGLVLALAALQSCQSLYLPGVAPLDFAKDDVVYFKARQQRHSAPGHRAPAPAASVVCLASSVVADAPPLQVNSLTSAKSALPLEYYSLPFCR